jgi:hypothetical protein
MQQKEEEGKNKIEIIVSLVKHTWLNKKIAQNNLNSLCCAVRRLVVVLP